MVAQYNKPYMLLCRKSMMVMSFWIIEIIFRHRLLNLLLQPYAKIADNCCNTRYGFGGTGVQVANLW